MHCKLVLLLAFSLFLGPCKDSLAQCPQQMSLRDKVAQLMVPHHYDPEIDSLVARDHVGGVIVMLSSKAEVDSLIPKLQASASIPLFVCMDAEWGAAMRLKQDYKRLPKAAYINSDEQAYEIGKTIGGQLRELGIHANLAPVADVNTNPDNPVIGTRSFGADPVLVSSRACAYARGQRDAGIASCAKHFPGHGDSSVDSHQALPVLEHSRERLDSVELLPFRHLIDEGVEMVMTGHLSVPALDPSGTPASVSAPVCTFLRDSLGFQGVIVTDGMGMKGVTDFFAGDQVAACVAAFKAGADMILALTHTRQVIDAITALVQSGEYPLEELDAKVLRVLELKRKLGIIQ